MTTPLRRPRAATAPIVPSGRGPGPMLLVLFALVFVPVLAVHAAFVFAPPASARSASPVHRH